MKVWRSGTRLCSRASSRTSSSDGETSRPSLATGIELLEGVGVGHVARGQQHGEVVEHVGRLLADALVGLLARRARDLLGLLADLLADERRIGQQLRRVARAAVARRLARGDRPLQLGERLARLRIEVAGVEAAALAGVAGGAGRVDQ